MYRDLSTIQNGIESCHQPAKITKHENIVHPPCWEGQFVHSPAQIAWSTTTARHAWTAMSSAWTIIHLVESTWTAWSWYFELTSPWNICFKPQKPVGFDHHNSFSGIFLQHFLGYLKPGPWGLKNQLKSWAKIQIVFTKNWTCYSYSFILRIVAQSLTRRLLWALSGKFHLQLSTNSICSLNRFNCARERTTTANFLVIYIHICMYIYIVCIYFLIS